jgi:hypothetical protein
VPEAVRLLTAEEADKLVDMERVSQEALDRVQNTGIVFLDEIDKIATGQAGGGGGHGPDVSRGGVQRDCCRSSKAARSRRSMGWSRPITSCSSRRVPFMRRA